MPPPWVAAPQAGDPSWLATHRALAASVPSSDPGLLFVGDSITFAWPITGAGSWATFAQWKPADIGVVGDTTQNVLWRLDHGEISGIAPRAAVVMIGTNNLGLSPPAQIARGIEAVVTDLTSKLPTTRVLLLGVLPIDTPGSPRHPLPGMVDSILARYRFGPPVTYLDLSPLFTTQGGDLRSALYHRVCLTGTTFCDDLEHPSAAGYGVMTKAVLRLVSRMMS